MLISYSKNKKIIFKNISQGHFSNQTNLEMPIKPKGQAPLGLVMILLRFSLGKNNPVQAQGKRFHPQGEFFPTSYLCLVWKATNKKL